MFKTEMQWSVDPLFYSMFFANKREGSKEQHLVKIILITSIIYVKKNNSRDPNVIIWFIYTPYLKPSS